MVTFPIAVCLYALGGVEGYMLGARREGRYVKGRNRVDGHVFRTWEGLPDKMAMSSFREDLID